MFTTPRLVAIALCAALNFAIGNIVYLIKLPIYLDSIGTILCALLIFPDRLAAIACAFVAGFIGGDPERAGDQSVPALVHADRARHRARVGAVDCARDRDLPRTTAAGCGVRRQGRDVYGIITGIASAVVSAPVVVYLFGGVTGSGSAFVVAFFLKTGQQLLNSARAGRADHRADRQDAAGPARRAALPRDAARIHRHAARRSERRRR